MTSWSLRPFLVAAAVLVLAGVNVYLVATERIAPSEARARQVIVRDDPLLSLAYVPSAREKNLAAMGLDADQVARVMDRLRDLGDRHTEKVDVLLETAEDATAVTDALCGQTAQVRPRYGALRYLVTDREGRRNPVSVARMTSLQEQTWTKSAPIAEVYDHIELASERQPDATRMALAAILAGREIDALESRAPWGRGFAATWSWARVEKEHPGIEDQLLDYLAVMHFFVERATREGGVCGE